jgi:hypothetical protein
VALREDRDQHALEKVVLPDDHLLHFIEDALHEGSDVFAVHVVVNHDVLSGAADGGKWGRSKISLARPLEQILL